MIETATPNELKHMLALFPAKALRDNWSPIKGSNKNELCHKIVEGGLQAGQRGEIVDFVDQNFHLCKQHVYVYEAPMLKSLPNTIEGGGIQESGNPRRRFTSRVLPIMSSFMNQSENKKSPFSGQSRFGSETNF